METCSSLLGITSELNNHLRGQTAGKTMSLIYNIYYLDFSIKNWNSSEKLLGKIPSFQEHMVILH